MGRARLGGRSLGILLAALLGAGAAAVPRSSGVNAPERNDEGDWYGTWTYVNREQQFAFYVRQGGALPEVRVQYQATSNPESFVTDWTGRASYRTFGQPATFELRLVEGDENTLRGTWDWQTWRGSTQRSEQGNFTLYRSGDGRKMVLQFEDFTEGLRSGDRTRERSEVRQWSLRKLSKRIVRWDELPF